MSLSRLTILYERRKVNLDEEDTTDIWTAILDLKTIFSLVLLCIFEFDSFLRGIWKQILQCHRCIESHMMQGKLANLEADVEPLTLMQLSRFLIRSCMSRVFFSIMEINKCIALNRIALNVVGGDARRWLLLTLQWRYFHTICKGQEKAKRQKTNDGKAEEIGGKQLFGSLGVEGLLKSFFFSFFGAWQTFSKSRFVYTSLMYYQ